MDEHSSLEQKLNEYRFALSKVSHEIRNPVTLINSYLQLLEKAHPELTQDELWSDLTVEMTFLRHLLDDLSYYNNTYRCHLSDIDMTPWLLKLSESACLLFPGSQVSYHVSIPENLPCMKIDPLKLNQALINLLRNAFEAASQQITFSVIQTEHTLQIEIINDGAAIDPTHLDDFFKPFATTKENGTGLGLPIAKGIIEAHGGTLMLIPSQTSDTSNHKSGTHLRILLPLC
ncbi:MAG: HAMP domain-containing histidine kinase [Blautia sp.]|nr:HAMP domain-containing histidine kinase [Blautia sp.]